MAQDWTKIRNDLANDPAVVQVAKALNIDPDAVVGKLLRLWAWAGEHTTTGVVRDACALVVDHIIRVEGFARALADAHWLELRNDNTIFFPKWNTHNSKSAKRRALHNKQVARKRARSVRKTAHTVRTESAPEKRREEKSIGGDKSPPKTPSISAGGNSSSKPNAAAHGGFDRFWKLWPERDRKVGKAKCADIWRSKKLEAQSDDVLAGLRRWIGSRSWAEGFDPQPARWLREQRWLTVPESAEDSGSGMVACGPVSEAKAREILGLEAAA